MKTSVFFLVGMLITVIATSQNQELKEIEVTPPTFKGEFPNSVNKYVQSAEYPKTELKWGIQGTVVVGFVVTPEGELNNIEVINSLSSAIDNEVIRMLESTNSMWTPGIKNGEAVAMPNEVSVVFKLYPEDNFTEIAKKYFHKGNHALFVKEQPDKALKLFNRGIKYLPNDESLLVMRGICKYQLGDEIGANRDWGRLKVLASRRNSGFDFKNLSEYIKTPGITEELSELMRDIDSTLTKK